MFFQKTAILVLEGQRFVVFLLVADVLRYSLHVRMTDGEHALTLLPLEWRCVLALRFDPYRRAPLQLADDLRGVVGSRKIEQRVYMIGGPADDPGGRIKRFEYGGEVRVHLFSKGDKWDPVFRREHQVDMNLGKGLRHGVNSYRHRLQRMGGWAFGYPG